MRSRQRIPAASKDVAPSDVNIRLESLRQRLGDIALDKGLCHVGLIHYISRENPIPVTDHLHPDMEFTCLIHGAITWTTATGHTVHCRAGDVLIMPPHLIHRWQASSASIKVLGVMLQVDGPAWDRPQLWAKSNELAYRIRHPASFAILTDMLNDLHKESERDVNLAAVRYVVTCWLDHLRSQVSAEQTSNAEPSAKVTQQARAWFRAHVATCPGIADIARNLGISTRHLNRCFQQAEQRSVSEALNEIRLKMACHLLLTTEATIASICQQCGYANASHFTRVFRQYFKTTPAVYRREACHNDPTSA